MMKYIVIVAGIFGLDYFVKRKVEEEKELDVTEEHCGGKILIRRTNNSGIAFGLFQNDRRKVNAVQLTGLILMGGIYLWLLCQKGYGMAKAGVSCVLGGGLSNWYDRVRQGYVTDYISFRCPWKKFQNLVFNVSDFFIFLGCILTGVSEIFQKK